MRRRIRPLVPFAPHVPSEAIHDSVDEVAGIGGGEFLAHVDGFIEDDFGRGAGIVDEFPCGEAEDVAVDGGHAIDRPFGGDFPEPFVGGGTERPSALGHEGCDFANGGVFGGFADEG